MRKETNAAIAQALEMGSVAIDAAIAETSRLRAALDAARAHNADLSATLEARVQAARAKALEDAAKVAESPYTKLFADGWTAAQCSSAISAMMNIAAAIRGMKEQEDKG